MVSDLQREFKVSTSTILLKFLLPVNVVAIFIVASGNLRAQEKEKESESPTAIAIHGTPEIDGEIEDTWKNAPEFTVKRVVKSETTMPEAGPQYKEDNLKAVAKKAEGRYLVEMSVRLSHAKREAGTKLGLELQINDDQDTGSRGGISKWHHAENDSYEKRSAFGTLLLKETAE